MKAPTAARPGTAPLSFVDLAAQHAELRGEIMAAFADILDTSGFVGGPHLDAFETAFADYVGARHAVGVGNGTDAVRIALQLAGVTAGDAVITVSHTFIGSIEGALQIGALPLFVDIDAHSKTLSPSSLARLLDESCRADDDGLRHIPTGRRIAAVLPVHLYGQSAHMAPILELGKRYGIPVVEDAAQAQGARYRFPDGRLGSCGQLGLTAGFSFYPGKNLGAMGEAGAVTTDDPELAARARMLRDHGQSRKYVHELPDGGNSRLDALQAAVLALKLDRLEEWNDRRRAVADRYRQLLGDLAEAGAIELPEEEAWAHHIYHLFVIQSPQRDALQAELAERQVPTGLHYPIPLHLQPAFTGQGLEAEPLPVTEEAAATCLSLPMHPHMSDEQVDRVAAAVRESLSSIGA